jgi:hypothetical protein
MTLKINIMDEVKITTKEYLALLNLQHSMAIELTEGTVKFENTYTATRIKKYVDQLMNPKK